MKRQPNEREILALREIFLRAETEIINEVASLRQRGLADYHKVAALQRVQDILKAMQEESWEYVPQMIEKMFYVRVPEARKLATTARQALIGYQNAMKLSSTQMDAVQLLTLNLMEEIKEASETAYKEMERALIGRVESDVFRYSALRQTRLAEAKGEGMAKAFRKMVAELQREGVTGFVDRAGRKWNLHSYCNMACRTTSAQADTAAVLTADPEHDLYKVLPNGTTCKICAAAQGRVYSKSGTNPNFPPLSSIFGKVDPLGADDLSNTYWNIHPNCLHSIVPWTPIDEEEEKEASDFSSLTKRPLDVDYRTQKQIERYRTKERSRRRYLNDYKQFEKYRLIIPEQMPKTFDTFLKHKYADGGKPDKKFTEWQAKVKEEDKYSKVRHHKDGTIVVTDVWEEHRSIPTIYKQNAVVETRFPEKQVDRIYYDGDGKMFLQVHSGDHHFPKQHKFGKHGEHQHYVTWDNGKMKVNKGVELTERFRKENADILDVEGKE